MPYAFASHFAPTHLFDALQLYRENFRPSEQLQKPYSMACVNVIAADTDEEAEYLATSLYQLAMGIITNTRRPLQPPVKNMESLWDEHQKAMILNMMYYTFIGSKETVTRELSEFVENTGVQEIIAVSHIYDQTAKLKSYKILSQVFKESMSISLK